MGKQMPKNGRDFFNNRKACSYFVQIKHQSPANRYRREIYLVKKENKSDFWFAKIDRSEIGFREQRLYLEVVAQEFRRMIHRDGQPKTRMIFSGSDSNNFAYRRIVSKAVPGFVPLSSFAYLSFRRVNFGELGKIIASSFFLAEYDLKSENIGMSCCYIDDKSNIIQTDRSKLCVVDGDCALVGEIQALYEEKLIINSEIIEDPFALGDKYKPYNWLDFIKWGLLSQKSQRSWRTYVSQYKSNFYRYFYATLLMIICLPENFFKRFCEKYAYGQSEDYAKEFRQRTSDYLLNRQHQLQDCVYDANNFREYVTKQDSRNLFGIQIKDILAFIPKSKEKLILDSDKFIYNMLTAYGEVVKKCEEYSQNNTPLCKI